MSDFPVESILFNSEISQAEAMPHVQAWLRANRQMPGGNESEIIAIIDGTITPTRADCIVDTEGGASTDELLTISVANMSTGAEVRLFAADMGRVVTVKHQPGVVNGVTLVGGADKALSPNGYVHLKRNGDFWREVRNASVTMPDLPIPTPTLADAGKAVLVGDPGAFVFGAIVTPEELAVVETLVADKLDASAYAAASWGRPFAMALISSTAGIIRANNIVAAEWIGDTGYRITMQAPANDANYGVLASDSGYANSSPGAAHAFFVYDNATYPKTTTQFVVAPRYVNGDAVRPNLCLVMVYKG